MSSLLAADVNVAQNVAFYIIAAPMVYGALRVVTTRNVVHGALSSTAPPRFADAAGGLLCDEPGLWKTVTALALVLARRGARASR